MASKKEKFEFEPMKLGRFVQEIQADEADISADEWNALTPAKRKAHLKKWNESQRKIALEEWNDAIKEGWGEGEPEPEGKRKEPAFKPKKQPRLKSGGLTTGQLQLGTLMKSQPGSGGSEGLKYLHQYSPNAVEARQLAHDAAERKSKPEPVKKPAKKPAKHIPEEGARKGYDKALGSAGLTRGTYEGTRLAYGDANGF